MEGGSSGGPPASQAGGAETEVPRKDDVLLLADEKFDFDLSLSSLSANEDDEVFFGPVGHKERCVAASLELGHPGPSPPQPPSSVSESPFRWSPLAGEKFVEVYKEARLLALQIESSSRSAAPPAPAGPEDAGSQGVERFIQESRLKMLLFEREKEAQKSPNSLKRETYCLLDSPASGPQLPGSQPASGVGPAGAQGPPGSSRPLPVETSPARPPRLAVPQKKVASRLPPPRASSARGGSLPVAAEKPPKEKPASPSKMKIPHEKEPHGAARDATTLPASRSHLVQGKRSLPAPNKLGLKKTQLRLPGGAGGPARQPCARGSVPGGSAGLGASPAAGRGDSTTPRFSGARRLQSCTSAGRVAHSTPAPRPSGPARTPASTTRASGLPTPTGRRLSGLPLVTPSTVPRTLASPLCVSTRQLSSEPRRTSAGRATLGNGGSQAVAPGSDVSSDGSLSPAVPQALSFSPEKSEAAVSESAAAERVLDAAQPPEEAAPREAVLVDVPLGQRVTPSTGCPLGDHPLIDLSLTPEAPVASGPGSRPLLDLLANTPDTDRKATAKPLPGVGQLIDLCSPLIQLSPEANKENMDSPLLRF
uniref:G2 and S-phase expressed 1 n=1 Tax=Myotis myotis TaxID=51298 RepID=A0A7J7Z2W7_MYOMY|nr:G2 and S-phase expressed 1 [Myotis myotis]